MFHIILITLIICIICGVLIFTGRFRINRARTPLEGKNILITGCDSGFGYSLALHCADNGMNVLAGCYLEDSEGGKFLESIDNITVVGLDVTNSKSLDEALTVVRRVCGTDGLHCLVNNAAVLVFGETMWQTEDQVRWQVEVNYLGPVRVSRGCLPLLVRGQGRIVNMISNCTECPLPTLGPYTASKVSNFSTLQTIFNFVYQGALLANTDIMRAELKKFGVKVVIVNPGDAPTETPLTTGQAGHYQRMDLGLTSEERQLHGDLFTKCKQYYSQLFPQPPLKIVENTNYYAMMDDVLGSAEPMTYYCNSDLVTSLVFTVIKYLPRKMSDIMRLKIMKCYEQ